MTYDEAYRAYIAARDALIEAAQRDYPPGALVWVNKSASGAFFSGTVRPQYSNPGFIVVKSDETNAMIPVLPARDTVTFL